MVPVPNVTTHAAAALVAAVLAPAGTWRVQEWRWQAKTAAVAEARAQAEEAARELRETDARLQRSLGDRNAANTRPAWPDSTHNWETPVRASQRYLTAAALTLALSACSTASANPPPQAWACEPMPATLRVRPQPLPDLPRDRRLRKRTRCRRAHRHLRARYAEVSGQLNQILDIEEGRNVGVPGGQPFSPTNQKMRVYVMGQLTP